jgi:phospholipid/cholesterol/gamma-HCH transport system substrate-binding protein
MKIANETKVGLMAVIALAGLILGFNFLKGSSLFQHSKKLYALFKNVDGMDVSNAVQIEGFTVGTITSINETDADLSRGSCCPPPLSSPGGTTQNFCRTEIP